MGADTAPMGEMQKIATFADFFLRNPILEQVRTYPLLSSPFQLIQALKEEPVCLKIKANGLFSC